MRRFQYNRYDDQNRNTNWIDTLNSIISFVNENSNKEEVCQQIKIKDFDNSLFLGESKYGHIAINKEYLNDVRTLIVGQPGSGKSYLTRTYIEELLEKEILVFVLDPEGEWVTLKSKYDLILLGKNKSKDYCDIEINEENFEQVIEGCLTKKCSAIINLSEWSEDEDKQKLVTILNTYLIDKAPGHLRQLTNIIYEEASIFAKKNDNSAANQKCKASLKEVAAQGRKRGISSTFITQRITFLSPDIISQCNTYLFGLVEGISDVERTAQILGIKPKNYGIIKELNKEFIAHGKYFCHHGQIKDTQIIFRANKPSTPHFDLMQLLKYEIPRPNKGLQDKINFITSQVGDKTPKIEQNSSQTPQNKDLDAPEPAAPARADSKIEKFEQIVSCLGSIKLKDLYVLAIEKYNPVEAQFEITKWLRGNSSDYLQVEDEIYAKEIKKIKIEDATWFLNKWIDKIDDDKYCKLVEYLFSTNNNNNTLKEIVNEIGLKDAKELNELYLKHIGTGLLYAHETELCLNEIFFHHKLNEVDEELIESSDEEEFDDFEEMDSYN